MNTNIFIGSSPNNYDREIEIIYEYSLRKNCKADIEINWMRLSNQKKDFWSDWKTQKWFTPFSGFRWGIPHFCDFKGRVIYTDVDMINFRDISDLLEIDMQGKPFAARKGIRWGYELCVMVIDCDKAKDHLWKIHKLKSEVDSHQYHRRLLSNEKFVATIDSKWNCLDGEDMNINEIYQLHFTNMSTQPWKPSWYKGEHKVHPRKDILDLYQNYKDEANVYSKLKDIDKTEYVDFEIAL